MPAILIDGIHFADRVVLIAMGVDERAGKHILGIREGSSEAARVISALLSALIERGRDAQRPLLWVIDGGRRCVNCSAWPVPCPPSIPVPPPGLEDMLTFQTLGIADLNDPYVTPISYFH